ncbi:uncharacterized protein LOC144928228 [Branchiostoma floridae x Branchiostoma belcheri]
MKRNENFSLPHELELTISQLVHDRSPTGTISVVVPKTEQQTDGISCGLFAVAFAWEAAAGADVEQIRFDQRKMRAHLLSCLEAENLTAFPKLRRRKTERRITVETVIKVFCDCRRPQSIGKMLQCDLCSEWFHFRCIGLSAKEARSKPLEHWECPKYRPPSSKRPRL